MSTSATPTTHVFSVASLREAWEHVRANGGAAGGDRESLRHFENFLHPNLITLAHEVRTHTYQPRPVRFVSIHKPGKIRRLGIVSVRDRVLQRAVVNMLTPVLERQFLPCSFGYRPGKSLHNAADRIVKLRNRGLLHVVDADIRDCFGTINHQHVRNALHSLVPDIDPELCLLIDLWLVFPHGKTRGGKLHVRERGILQGSPLSPLLCNVCLHQFDLAMQRKRLNLVRYADDFVVLCKSREHAEHAVHQIRKQLTAMHLAIHPRKTRLTSFAQGFRFLGVEFKDDDVTFDLGGKRIVLETEHATHGLSFVPNRYE